MRRSRVGYRGGVRAPTTTQSELIDRDWEVAVEDSYYDADFTEEYEEPMLQEGAPRNRTVNPVPESLDSSQPPVKDIVVSEGAQECRGFGCYDVNRNMFDRPPLRRLPDGTIYADNERAHGGPAPENDPRRVVNYIDRYTSGSLYLDSQKADIMSQVFHESESGQARQQEFERIRLMHGPPYLVGGYERLNNLPVFGESTGLLSYPTAETPSGREGVYETEDPNRFHDE